MRIDVGAVLAARLGRRPPRAVTAALERLVCQSRLNAMLEYAWPRRGADFCRAVVEHLGITVRVDGLDRLPASPRIIAVSNHPLGGLDGMILIDIFSRAYGRDVRFVVNDLLGAVEPLSDVFVPVNKHGAQSRDYAAAVEAAFASDAPVLMFPAGLCSRRRDGRVADLEWQKMFVLKAAATAAPWCPCTSTPPTRPASTAGRACASAWAYASTPRWCCFPPRYSAPRGAHLTYASGIPSTAPCSRATRDRRPPAYAT